MDEVFERATYGIAAELQTLAFEGDVAFLYESDLRSAARRALQMHVSHPVVLEASATPSSWKPKTGRCDVAIRNKSADGFDALAELKLWKSEEKADEAVWDAWKLGSAYKESIAPNVYLIAAGPRTYWDGPRLAVTFWDDMDWKPAASWEAYAKWWKTWVTPTSGPLQLPAGIRTRRVAAVPVHLFRTEPWEVRCSRVTTTPGPAWTPPEPA